MRRIPALFVALLCAGAAHAGLDVPPAPAQAPDLSNYAKKTDLSDFATTDAMAAAIANAYATQTKLAAPPSTGPGAGLCKFSVVPSNTIQSGGVAGTAGTCSRIVQCGTSATYVVAQFNIGDGC